MNLYYQPGIPQGHHFLPAEESRHCAKVMRAAPGDLISVTDGNGKQYEARLTTCKPDRCDFTIVREAQEKQRQYRVHIAISPTRNPERLDWFVEKAVEAGIDQITFLKCARTARPSIKNDRLLRIAISAMKQSWRATLPYLSELTPFEDFIREKAEEARYVAHAQQGQPPHLAKAARPGRAYRVMIGPEGDFTPEELEEALRAGFEMVSLGESRLRTETAGIAATFALNLINL